MPLDRLLAAMLVIAVLASPVASLAMPASTAALVGSELGSATEEGATDEGPTGAASVDLDAPVALPGDEPRNALSEVSEAISPDGHVEADVLGDIVGAVRVTNLRVVDAPRVLVVVGYSRYDSSDPLDNGVRRQIYEAIEHSPGTYSVELSTTTGIPRSTIRYHVRILEDERLIFTEKVRGKQRYFPRHSQNVELVGALGDEASRAALLALDRSGPATVSKLAGELDRATSTTSYHLSRLADAGLVEQERDDGVVLNRLSARTRAELQRLLAGEVEPPARA